ncbi:MAG: hypothetical protein JNL79_16500 [Myxococcales bacterium]|nr:hypothetical protein [Myxococcales bacterium]
MRSKNLLLGLAALSTLALACALPACGGDDGTGDLPVEDSAIEGGAETSTDTGVDTGSTDSGTDTTTTDSTAADSTGDSTATDSTATDSTATDSTATDSTATDSSAADSAATDSTATDSATDGGDAGAAKDKAAGDLAAAICNRWKACNDFAFTTRWVDVATCTARHKLELLDRLDAPGTGDTITSFGTCTTAYPTFSCTELATNDVPTACKPVGTVASAGACSWHSQCATGYCAREGDEPCGTCAAKPVAAASCTTFEDCGYGLLCVLDKCVKLGRDGDACDVDGAAGAVKPCGPGFGCVVTGTATTGLCNTPIATGAECDYNEQCDQGNGFYCKSGALATDPSTCQKLAIHAAGGTCDETATIAPAECTGGTSCYLTTGVAGGKCVANAAEGATCNLTETSGGPSCTYPAVCDSTTSKCLLPQAKLCL